MTDVLFRFPALSLLPGHRPAHEQICSAVLNGFISMPISAMIAQEAVVLIPFTDMRISSIRFLVVVFKQESKAGRSICPCSVRCRMMFLPEAPKISEIGGKTEARALQGLLNPVFLGCDVTDDALTVTV